MTVGSLLCVVNPVESLREMLSFSFMQNAFLTGTMVAALAGLAGFFLVLRRATFAGEALSDIAFAAALGAALFGVNLLGGMYVATVVAALALGFLGGRVLNDVSVGIVLAWVLGLGALFLNIYTSNAGGGSNGQIGINVLFGSILGVQRPQAIVTVLVSLAAGAVLLLVARPLLFASLDPLVASARGVPVRPLGLLFLALLAVTVAQAVQVVGALLILALLVLPSAIAQRLTTRPFRALWLSAAIAIAIMWSGLVLGYYLPYPVSFLITTIGFATYLGVLAGHALHAHLSPAQSALPTS